MTTVIVVIINLDTKLGYICSSYLKESLLFVSLFGIVTMSTHDEVLNKLCRICGSIVEDYKIDLDATFDIKTVMLLQFTLPIFV